MSKDLKVFVREMFTEDGVMQAPSFVDNKDTHMFYYDNMHRVGVLEFAQYLESTDDVGLNLLSTLIADAHWTCSHYEDGQTAVEYLWDVNGKDYLYLYMFADYSYNLYSVRPLSEHPYLRGL